MDPRRRRPTVAIVLLAATCVAGWAGMVHHHGGFDVPDPGSAGTCVACVLGTHAAAAVAPAEAPGVGPVASTQLVPPDVAIPDRTPDRATLSDRGPPALQNP